MQLWEKFKGSYLSYLLMYNFYYLSFALFSVLISIYLLDKGFLPGEVSLVVSASFLSSMLVQPLIGMMSDRFSNKMVNIVLFLIAAVGGIFFIFANSLVKILIAYSFVMMLINGTNPIMEKMATTSPYKYGNIRIWGTIGFALGSQVSGLIYENISPTAVYVTFIGSILLSVVGVLGTSEERSKNRIIDHSNTAAVPEKKSYKQLFTNKKLLMYILISALFYGVVGVGNVYIPPMLEGQGIQVTYVSTILSIAVFFETPIVFFSHKFMDKISNKILLYMAFIAIFIQYLTYAVDAWTPLVVLATLLFKHPAGMLFIMINLKVVNTLVEEDYQMTALALIQTVRNLFSIIFQNVAGQMLNQTTYSTLFFTLVGVAIVGLVLISFYKIPSGNDKKTFS